ncbi:hypothetical protein GCM10027612_21350 [Microbispora bryophytorum subsp. camponoti]
MRPGRTGHRQDRRRAYLLYAHRKRLSRGGVLVLGPNRAFLGYISAVLPALGEVDVEQTTLDALLARVPARGSTARTPPWSNTTCVWPKCCAGRCTGASASPRSRSP